MASLPLGPDQGGALVQPGGDGTPQVLRGGEIDKGEVWEARG